MAEQGRRRLTTNTPSLNEPKGRSLRKVVSLSGQFHANILYREEDEASSRAPYHMGLTTLEVSLRITRVK